MIGLQVLAAATSDRVDFKGAWDKFWAGFQQGTGTAGIMNLLAVIGVILLVVTIVAWAFERRKLGGFHGSGRTSGKIVAAALVGALLVAPSFFLPLALGIVDLFINAAANLLKNVTQV